MKCARSLFRKELVETVLNKNHGHSNFPKFIVSCCRPLDIPPFQAKFFSCYTNVYYTMNIKEGGFSSKYHPKPVDELIESKLCDKFFNVETLSIEEWSDIKNELIANFAIVNENNFDSIIMNSLLKFSNIHLANSFITYLKDIKQRPNMVTCLKYISLCGRHSEVCGSNTILETFSQIKSFVDTAPVLDRTSVDCIIIGLSATDEWKKSFDYVKKLNGIFPSSEAKAALIGAALQHKDSTIAWDIMSKWHVHNEQPTDQAIIEFIKYATAQHQLGNSDSANNIIDRLFTFLRIRNIMIKSNVANSIMDYFKRCNKKWQINHSKINQFGICECCNKQLNNAKLSFQEFSIVKNSFLSKSIKKADIFINTTEKELSSFINFIEYNKPFDAVIDGLNASYLNADTAATIRSGKNRRNLALQLLEVIKRLSATSKRILVLGRRHMKYWAKPVMYEISKRATLFFTSNISEDDTFLVYATLASGPDAIFVTSDLLRDHIARLNDPKLIQLFERWRNTHQVYVHDSDSGPVFVGPMKHSICIEGNMNSGWHVPYDDEFVLEPYEVINNWLCIQKL